MTIPRNRDFGRNEIYPSYHIDRFQDFTALLSSQFRVRALNSTTVQVAAATGQGAAVISVGGRWRWVESTITRSMPGGAAGTYSIFVTAHENNVVNVPVANTDNTDYSFDLAITSGADPTGVDLFRLVATAVWDGTKITAIHPIVANADNTIPTAPTADVASQVPHRVSGVAGGGQTADLSQWYDQPGGTVLAQVKHDGTFNSAVGYQVAGTALASTHLADTALLARLASPALSGTPTAPTAAVDTNTTQVATTAYVVGQGYLKSAAAASTYAPLVSPALSGTPTAPTAAVDTNTTQVATTAYVVGQSYAKLASPAFTGTPSLPTGTTAVTQTSGDSTTKLATTAFVTTADNLKANLASPAFTGTPTAPTAAVNTNTTQVATTAFVVGQGYATSASPAFTGTPTGTTAAVDTNTTQLATTAFVLAQAASAAPLAAGAASVGTSTRFARGDHVHPVLLATFGDGSDGAATLDGSATVSWASKSGSTYTMTRDVYATNLTVNSGVTLITNSYRVFCTGTFNNAGTVKNNGPNGSTGNNLGTATSGGVGPTGASVGGGGLGGTGFLQGLTGNDGTRGLPAWSSYAFFGGFGSGAGGHGGAGSSGGTGGSGATVQIPLGGVPRSAVDIIANSQWLVGGNGGGGGA